MALMGSLIIGALKCVRKCSFPNYVAQRNGENQYNAIQSAVKKYFPLYGLLLFSSQNIRPRLAE